MHDFYIQFFNNGIKVTTRITKHTSGTWSAGVLFTNTGSDTIILSNVVPFGEDPSYVYITGYGPPDLARAYLFRPGYGPVRIILPDNAWEMGYSSFPVNKDYSVCAIARRQNTEGGIRRRYETILPPRSEVSYVIYAEVFKGEWQEDLKLMFRDKYLFDLEEFNRNQALFVSERETYLFPIPIFHLM